MLSNSTYQSRYHALKPLPALLTFLLVVSGMILGSIVAVILSWVWLAFTVTMLIVDSLRQRFSGSKTRIARNSPLTNHSPVTVEGVYTTIVDSSRSK